MDHKEMSASGARSWSMRIFLVWTLFPGGWAVTGPAQVTAEQGGSLVVSCSYEPHYKFHVKYWCRPAFLWFCFTYLAQTNGSEVTVTQGRVSIWDNHKAHSFTMMLHSVTPEDAGSYSCRVRRRRRLTLWHTTKVMVSAVVSTTTKGSNVSFLATRPLPLIVEPPVLSQLGITHLLLFLSVKVPMVLVLGCGAAWVRSRRRSRSQENQQLLEVANSTGIPSTGLPLAPEPQGHPPVPVPPTLPGLRHPSWLPRAGSCSALGASPLVDPQPLQAAPALERGGFGVQRACVC